MKPFWKKILCPDTFLFIPRLSGGIISVPLLLMMLCHLVKQHRVSDTFWHFELRGTSEGSSIQLATVWLLITRWRFSSAFWWGLLWRDVEGQVQLNFICQLATKSTTCKWPKDSLSFGRALSVRWHDWIRLTGSSKMLPGRWHTVTKWTRPLGNIVEGERKLGHHQKATELGMSARQTETMKSEGSGDSDLVEEPLSSGNLLSWKGTPEKRISQTWEAFWAL